jgi:hypothetical protein
VALARQQPAPAFAFFLWCGRTTDGARRAGCVAGRSRWLRAVVAAGRPQQRAQPFAWLSSFCLFFFTILSVRSMGYGQRKLYTKCMQGCPHAAHRASSKCRNRHAPPSLGKPWRTRSRPPATRSEHKATEKALLPPRAPPLPRLDFFRASRPPRCPAPCASPAPPVPVSSCAWRASRSSGSSAVMHMRGKVSHRPYKQSY